MAARSTSMQSTDTGRVGAGVERGRQIQERCRLVHRLLAAVAPPARAARSPVHRRPARREPWRHRRHRPAARSRRSPCASRSLTWPGRERHRHGTRLQGAEVGRHQLDAVVEREHDAIAAQHPVPLEQMREPVGLPIRARRTTSGDTASISAGGLGVCARPLLDEVMNQHFRTRVTPDDVRSITVRIAAGDAASGCATNEVMMHELRGEHADERPCCRRSRTGRWPRATRTWPAAGVTAAGIEAPGVAEGRGARHFGHPLPRLRRQ